MGGSPILTSLYVPHTVLDTLCGFLIIQYPLLTKAQSIIIPISQIQKLLNRERWLSLLSKITQVAMQYRLTPIRAIVTTLLA